MKNIIEVKNLSKNYGNIKAIDNLSFNVPKGILFAFLGPNGAGKSTTINILITALKHDLGHAKIGDYVLGIEDEAIRKKIGVVFQESTLDKLLTVYENLTVRVSFYGYSKREAKEKITEISNLLELNELLNRPYGELSGGQRRRVDIARALLNEPEILFLDEPTTGLDPQTRELVWKSIKNLQKKANITIFLTTHYMEEADSADLVAVIDKGKLIAYDTPADLKLKNSHNIIKIKTKNIDNFKKNYKKKFEVKNNIIIIKVKNSKEALKIINKYEKQIDDFEIISGNMDDVFLNLTGHNIKEGETK